MKITVIGTGYVGLVQSVCMAELGFEVIGVDIDQTKIAQLRGGQSPIYEPELEDLLVNNLKVGRLKFTSDLAEAVSSGYHQAIFIAVGTPSDNDGRADLKYVKAVAEDIGHTLAKNQIQEHVVIVNKSTVPVGTGDLVNSIVNLSHRGSFSVVSNPEFLREGSAVGDFLHPDRIVIGSDDQDTRAKALMDQLYEPLNCPIFHTDLRTAELIKYASNSMLATQISFINIVAEVAERVGADITQVAQGMKLDQRIGKKAFLSAGLGYGGSCFPKDVKALIAIAQDVNADADILESVEKINHDQRSKIIQKARLLLGDLANKQITIWGLAFKPNTDDMREAPAITIIGILQQAGAIIKAYDPIATNEARRILPDIEYCSDPSTAAQGSDLVIVVTEWDELRNIDLAQIKSVMKQPNIIDGRNIYNLQTMKDLGFNYLSVGRMTILNAPLSAQPPQRYTLTAKR